MIMNQLEGTMKCGPKPKDRPRWRTKNNRSVKKCLGEQRNYQSKIEMISVLSFGKAPNAPSARPRSSLWAPDPSQIFGDSQSASSLGHACSHRAGLDPWILPRLRIVLDDVIYRTV